MSHVADVEMCVTDLDACEAACARLGFKLVRGQTSYNWFGEWLNDWTSERAAGLRGRKPEDFGKCEHAIVIEGADDHAYQIGLVPRLDGQPGWDAIYDAWGSGHELERLGGVGLSTLSEEIGAEVALRQLMSAGFICQRQDVKAGA